MAKVTMPLLSMTASGQIGKTLVYFPWKKVKAVRSYVIPANPDTVEQGKVRTAFELAVDEYHLAKYDVDDKDAWNRLAAILASSMSGFNAFIKSWMDISPKGVEVNNPGHNGSLAQSGAGQFDSIVTEDGTATAVTLTWGYKKTYLAYTADLVETLNTWALADIAATSLKRVYGRFQILDGADLRGETGLFQVDIL